MMHYASPSTGICVFCGQAVWDTLHRRWMVAIESCGGATGTWQPTPYASIEAVQKKWEYPISPEPVPPTPHVPGISSEEIDRDAYDDFMRGL